MTRLHELRGASDVVLCHEDGLVVVVTPEGAVFDSTDTDDLTKFMPACGTLFDEGWRLATEEERLSLQEPRDRILNFVWAEPPPRPRPRLVKS